MAITLFQGLAEYGKKLNSNIFRLQNGLGEVYVINDWPTAKAISLDDNFLGRPNEAPIIFLPESKSNICTKMTTTTYII